MWEFKELSTEMILYLTFRKKKLAPVFTAEQAKGHIFPIPHTLFPLTLIKLG